MELLHYQITPSTLIKASFTWGADNDDYIEALSLRAGIEHTPQPRDAVAEHKESFLGMPYTVAAKPAISGHHTTFYGARVGLSNTQAEDIVGLDVGLLYAQAAKIHGLQVAGVSAIADEMRGVQIGGIYSHAAEIMKGIQLSVFNSRAEALQGLQASLYNVTREKMTGLQLGIINWLNTSLGFLGGVQLPNFSLGMYFKNADTAFN